MSLRYLEDAPKARTTVTPAMVSPYMEYRGLRVTESATELAWEEAVDCKAHRDGACRAKSGYTPRD